MIGLAISYLPLNASLRIQNLQFESALWKNTPRKKFNNFKHTILWSTVSTLFFEARQARHFMKHVRHTI